jgi:hypothetical protein
MKKISQKKTDQIIDELLKLHSGSTCTDKKTRLVINFNYIKK